MCLWIASVCDCSYERLAEKLQTIIKVREPENIFCKSKKKHMLCIEQEELILEILSLAHQYGFVELESAISEYLKEQFYVFKSIRQT